MEVPTALKKFFELSEQKRICSLSVKCVNLNKVSLPSAGGCRGETKEVNKLSQSTSHRKDVVLLGRTQTTMLPLPKASISALEICVSAG